MGMLTFLISRFIDLIDDCFVLLVPHLFSEPVSFLERLELMLGSLLPVGVNGYFV